jgi:carboxyl-terminal processing protease
MIVRVFSMLMLIGVVAFAAPAADLSKQYLDFVAAYHVDSNQMNLAELKAKVGQAVKTRCAQTKDCSSAKLYDDLKQITKTLDSTSSFVTPTELERFRFESAATTDSRYGLGFEIVQGVVYRVLPGSNAAEVGVRRGDKITGLSRDGKPWKASETVFPDAKLVTVKLERGAEKLEFSVQPEAGALAGLLAPEGRMLEPGVGYLRVPTFKVIGTAQKVQQVLTTLVQQGARKLVLDLRFNTGGYLDEGLLTMSLFFEGEVLKLRSKKATANYGLRGGLIEVEGVTQQQKLERPQIFGGAVVVLVNRSTSSAAEVLALAWRRASGLRTVGETTAGRASYAALPIKMLDGSELRLAVIRNLYPNLEPLPARLEPDIAVIDDVTGLTQQKDPVLEAGVKLL